MVNSPVSIGVITPGTSKTGANILQAINELGHRAVELDYKKMFVQAREDSAAISEQVDLILNWKTLSRTSLSMEYLGLLRSLEEVVPVMNTADSALLAGHKPSGLVRLHESSDVEIPETLYSIGSEKLSTEARRRPEVVHKPVMGGGGAEVQKISGDEYSMLSGPQSGLLQEPVETFGEDHNDVRAFVVNGVVVAAMQRNAPDDQWLTNISSGGDGEPVDLPDEAVDMARRATEILGVDVAGVDLIQKKHDGTWNVIEVNAPAGFAGLHEATGTNVAAYIAAAAIMRAGGTLETEVSELASTMDFVSAKRDAGGMCYPLQDGEEYEIAGRFDSTTVEYSANEDFSGYSVDRSVLSEIGAGPVRKTAESPVPGDDEEVFMVDVNLRVGDRRYNNSVYAVDLSDYEADFITELRAIVERSAIPKSPEETGDDQHTA